MERHVPPVVTARRGGKPYFPDDLGEAVQRRQFLEFTET